jgi:hypothetical protein
VAPPPRGGRGLSGFDGKGTARFAGPGGDPDEETAAGSLFGVRWWTLGPGGTDLSRPMPPLTVSAAESAEARVAAAAAAAAQIQGSFAEWDAGVNTAVCDGPGQHPYDQIPVGSCGCGFWAYWDPRGMPPPARGAGWDVLGVVEGFGAVTIGTLGFRCQQARIVGLHLATDMLPMKPGGPGAVVGRASEPDWVGQLWRNLTEDALIDRFGVRVYATPGALLVMHPPTEEYADPPRGQSWLDGMPSSPFASGGVVGSFRPPGITSTVASGPGPGRGASTADVLHYARNSGLYAAMAPTPAERAADARRSAPPPKPAPRPPRPDVTPLDALGVLDERRRALAAMFGDPDPDPDQPPPA